VDGRRADYVTDRLPPSRVAEIECLARVDLTGNRGQQAAARRTLELVREVETLRELLLLAYPHVPETAETRELVAKLKAEVDRK
jgi:hypothetical protein